ncbi:NAD(P)-dependent alcohol dehydrogenase [Mumia zhuanghuii]|uniref:NAD(P)-dependent alcohol dehydrogenase n=2 Tax=Mumia TaxID=1546255 RepID=A0ABW1QN02_9ACTN|nr:MULTISPECIES: NAD(P)-dependent alcohol dehydrogenase [Mumia]KAA1424888.1 NAD(P)-dependent alcohol dehydrogenase [Mumia zhuanghuii]
MKAIVQDEYGDADALQLRDVPDPAPAKGEVVLDVRAAGLERGAWHLMTGLPLVGRAAMGIRRPRWPLGIEVAGVVAAVGDGVSELAVGDAVLGAGRAVYAERARAKVKHLVAKPDELSFAEAAALPVSAVTALQAVRDVGRVKAGDRVLVIGASGGVGTYAVQIARSLGAEVAGVCRTDKVEGVRALGADPVLDYTRDDLSSVDGRFDVVIDIGGRRPLSRLRRLLTPRGTLVITGGEGGGRWLGGLERQMIVLVWSPFLRQRLTSFISVTKAADLATVADLAARGEIRPVIDSTSSLDAMPDAMRRLVAGDVLGKIVISVSG